MNKQLDINDMNALGNCEGKKCDITNLNCPDEVCVNCSISDMCCMEGKDKKCDITDMNCNTNDHNK